MRKTISRLCALVALTMICSIALVGCSTPKQDTKKDDSKQDDSKNEDVKGDTKDDTKDKEPVISTELPVTGIGAIIKTEVKATGTYKISMF